MTVNLLQETDHLIHTALEHVDELEVQETMLLEVLRAGVNAYRIGYLEELMEDVQTAVQAAEDFLEAAYESQDHNQLELFGVKEPIS